MSLLKYRLAVIWVAVAAFQSLFHAPIAFSGNDGSGDQTAPYFDPDNGPVLDPHKPLEAQRQQLLQNNPPSTSTSATGPVTSVFPQGDARSGDGLHQAAAGGNPNIWADNNGNLFVAVQNGGGGTSQYYPLYQSDGQNQNPATPAGLQAVNGNITMTGNGAPGGGTTASGSGASKIAGGDPTSARIGRGVRGRDGSSDPTAEPSPAGPAYTKDGYYNANDHITSEDSCKFSATINGQKYACDGTKAWVDGAKIANQTTQIVGSVTTQALGQQATAQAYNSQNQAQMMEIAGTLQKRTAALQMIDGAMNAMLAAEQYSLSGQHEKNEKALRKSAGPNKIGFNENGVSTIDSTDPSSNAYIVTKGGTADTTKILNNFSLNDAQGITEVHANPYAVGTPEYADYETKRKLGEKKKMSQVNTQVTKIAATAAGEQHTTSVQATSGAFMSAATGAQQLVGGFFNYQAAIQEQKAAKTLGQIEGSLAAQIQPPGFSNPSSDPFPVSQPNPIVGANTGAAQAASSTNGTNQGTGPTGDLGAPFNPNGSNNGLTGTPPPAGMGGPLAGSAPGAAAPMGAGGNATTSPATMGADAEPTAKMASNNVGATPAVGNSNGGMGGGGGGIGGDKDTSGGALKDMLDNLMNGKKEDLAQNGILDYGSRSPAANEPISLLDRNANIFNRLHDTYQDKQRKGNVGI